MKNKSYCPNEIEQRWYPIWEKNNYFAPTGKGKPYSIIIPPPNVTGTLHMGHGFQNSIMDALIRYHRMLGDNTHWQLGTDHAGIATQLVVANQLLAEGTDRHQLGRDAFLKRVWDWKNYSESTITNQLRRLGISGDWQRQRFTLDPGLVTAVQQVFIQLYEEGLIYRGQRLVNWDPVLHTALSDLEVVSEDCQGSLWYIRYPIVDDNENVVIIATTRPETLLGDVAVAVNPNDSRYQHLIGKQVRLPLTDRTIPIIADEYVVQEFGTGCVKITPAHDFNDYEVGKRHNLAMINILTKDAKINDNAPAAYQNLDRFDARKKILIDLEAQGLIVKTEPHQLKIPKGDRSGVIVEPLLTDQWFVDAKVLAKPAIEAVKAGKIKFIPENWSKTYFNWLENIQDWCISRQLWWGHRIPAWYDDQDNVYVGHSESAIRAKYQLSETISLTQDQDVLDTWFSSALWPFSSLGWPEKTLDLQQFYPSNVLVTGFDIIFFWVARMVMFGLKFSDQVPFKEVYITGLIRDSQGQKMSKSKGNILDPVDLIDGIDLESLIKKRASNLLLPHLAKSIESNTRAEFPNGIPAFGADALRFTFCALASTSRDINFDLNRLEGYRNFCNKIWNAIRFVLMQTESYNHTNTAIELNIVDQWIESKLQQTIELVKTEFNNYRFDLITQAIYEFTWHDFCDWYLELSKPVLTSESSSEALKQGTRKTLLTTVESLLRLIHPFMPFITEELWQTVAPKLQINGATIMLQPYPQFDVQKINLEACNEVEWLKRIILAIRNIRGEINISPNKLLPLILSKGIANDHRLVDKHQKYLSSLAKIVSITWLDPTQTPPLSATGLVDQLELHIPIADLIDTDAEINRLTKEIKKLEKEIELSTNKLNNTNYTAKAPAAVVEKERKKTIENLATLEKFQQKLNTLIQ